MKFKAALMDPKEQQRCCELLERMMDKRRIMENKIDWDRMAKAVGKFIFKYQRGPIREIPDAIGKIREYYEEPEFKPLGEEIWYKANKPERGTFANAITKVELNEAVKDIDYPCQKVHFPEPTKQIDSDFSDDWSEDLNSISDCLKAFYERCKEGVYDKKDCDHDFVPDPEPFVFSGASQTTKWKCSRCEAIMIKEV